MSERIDILGQHPPKCCEPVKLMVSSSMPAALSSQIQDQAWQQFVMQADAALRPVGEKMSRLLLLRTAMFLAIIVLVVGMFLYTQLTLQAWISRDVDEEDDDGGAFSKIPVGFILLPLPVIVFVCGLIVVSASLRSVARKAQSALAEVCSRATLDNPGLTFEVKSEFYPIGRRSLGNRYFIEVTWSAEARPIAAPVVEPMPCQPVVYSLPGQANVFEASVVSVAAPGGSVARFCSGCGAACVGDAKFCGSCGRQFP
mmetsp:Transcript_41733/g.96527  ORF Transcript_41733/g.96527 Transcript_41733/m.96527 type:complete len:256 (+) Transcript_41733:82-849(+)